MCSGPVAVKLADETNFSHTGRMDFVDNVLNPKTGTIRGRAVFDNKDGLLTPGCFGRLRLFGGETNALLVPDSAIASDQSNRIVFVVANDGTVGVKRVELGPIVEGLRVIRSGLVVVRSHRDRRPATRAARPKSDARRRKNRNRSPNDDVRPRDGEFLTCRIRTQCDFRTFSSTGRSSPA